MPRLSTKLRADIRYAAPPRQRPSPIPLAFPLCKRGSVPVLAKQIGDFLDSRKQHFLESTRACPWARAEPTAFASFPIRVLPPGTPGIRIVNYICTGVKGLIVLYTFEGWLCFTKSFPGHFALDLF